MSNTGNPISIKPNAKLITILMKIREKIKNDFFITKPVLHENKGIMDKSFSEFIKTKPYIFKKIEIKERSFVTKNIVVSLDLKIGTKCHLTGNFLAVFEDWYMSACDVLADQKYSEDINNIITYYESFSFETINPDKTLLNNTLKAIDDGPPSSEAEAEDLKDGLIKIGTYCYCHRNTSDLKKANTILTKAEKLIIKGYTSTTKDFSDEILLLISILKYHVFRLTKNEEKDRYYKRIVHDVRENLKKLSENQDKNGNGLKFTVLYHSAYLKALIDGESYNFDKGKKIAEQHGTKAASVSFMSRNLSHNIGSHIIAYWNSKLEQHLKDVDEYSDDQKLIKSSKELLQYIQHRMDFIAEVSTAVPCSEMSVDIEKDILGPLIKPNNDKYGDEEEISSLLRFIAHSEGMDLHKQIALDIDKKIVDKGQRASIPNGFIGMHAVYSILENFIRNAAKHYDGHDSPLLFEYDNIDFDGIKRYLNANGLRPVVCAIKNKLNDVTNRKDCCDKLNELINGSVCLLTKEEAEELEDRIQALYERYREAQAHEKKNINREILERILPISDTVIKIDIREHSRDYVIIRIWDMREGSCNSQIVKIIKQYLPGVKDCSFSEEGKLKSGGWGIKEMIICANFLRKNTPEELYFRLKNKGGKLKNHKAPALFNVLCDRKTNQCKTWKNDCYRQDESYKGKLGIEFYLRKPKDLCLTLPLSKKAIKAKIFGIDPVSKYKDKEIPHRMMLVANEQDRITYFDNPVGPYRVILDKSKSQLTSINDIDYVDLYEKYVQKYIWRRTEPLPRLVPIGGGLNFGETDLASGNISNPARKLFFVYHLPTDYNFVENVPGNGNRRQFTGLFGSCLYLQPVSAGYSTKAKLTNPPADPLSLKHFCLEYIEASLTKVIIVDERLSDWAGKEYANGKKIRDILAKMGIFVIEISLEKLNYDQLLQELKLLKKSHIKNNASFFIIHQGVLDKLRIRKRVADINLMEYINDLFWWKIIDSGRGVPEALEKYEQFKVRFVEISGLKRQLENYDKHGLVQLLFSTRLPPKS